MNTSSLTRTPVLVVGTALAALVLSACGSDPSTVDSSAGSRAGRTAAPAASASYGPPATGPHVAQDVTFVDDMLPHHAQAVEMADMALRRDTVPEVKALAQQIRRAQAPEISSMSGWLVGWGEPVPSADTMGSHTMGGMGNGMMSANQMTALDQASGRQFAEMWLTDMTEHHTGAVAMARTEVASGQNADAKELATDIIRSQTAEIRQMQQLLAALA